MSWLFFGFFLFVLFFNVKAFIKTTLTYSSPSFTLTSTPEYEREVLQTYGTSNLEGPSETI